MAKKTSTDTDATLCRSLAVFSEQNSADVVKRARLATEAVGTKDFWNSLDHTQRLRLFKLVSLDWRAIAKLPEHADRSERNNRGKKIQKLIRELIKTGGKLPQFNEALLLLDWLKKAQAFDELEALAKSASRELAKSASIGCTKPKPGSQASRANRAHRADVSIGCT